MSYAEQFETFCLSMNLAWGNPKGLGHAMQRRSTIVGGKGPFLREELTASDYIQISAIARGAGLQCDDEKQTRDLYAKYLDWHRQRCETSPVRE